MPGLYSPYKIYAPGEVLTAADLNATDQTHITNQTPQMTDDYSQDLAQKRIQMSAFGVLAQSLAEEIAQLRNSIARLGRKTYWDEVLGAAESSSEGCEMSNDPGDLVHDILVQSGVRRASDNTYDIVLPTAVIKRLDAPWAVGSGQGMLDTGAIAASSIYHVFLIMRTDTEYADILATKTIATPVMPPSYTKSRRLGSIFTDASGNVRAFLQHSNLFLFKTPVLDLSVTNPTTAGVLRTLNSVPDGVKVEALLNWYYNNTGAFAAYFSSPDVVDLAPSLTLAPLTTLRGGLTVLTDTARQIRTRVTLSGGSDVLRVSVLGYYEKPRG